VTARVKTIALALIAILLVASVLSLVFGAKTSKTATLYYQRATGLYTGSGVRILGVQVGKVLDVQPQGTTVKVKIKYNSKYKIPANAQGFIIPPSLVSDRFVQIAPVYRQGEPVLPDKGVIPLERTQVPVELSQVLESADQIAQALGPNGANKNGALSRLISISADNLRGNGTKIHQTVRDVSTLLTTLAENKDDLNGTIQNLDTFNHALRESDGAVRQLTEDLASVASQLNEDRGNLAAAIKYLGIALGDITTFVRTNRSQLVGNVDQINKLTNTILAQKNALIETLDDAPTALQNLNGAYDPDTKSLRTKSNVFANLNPADLLCATLASVSGKPDICNDLGSGPLLDILKNLLGGGT
jgi:phospholipid/cholesterol/gamma-HCH transport system substrate-binding protein